MLSIRTQDRMALVPYDKTINITEETKVEYNNNTRVYKKTGKCFLETETYHKRLGTYATKERALEVLDEIEQHVVGKMLIKESITMPTLDFVYNPYEPSKVEVYRMPKEWVDDIMEQTIPIRQRLFCFNV